MGDRAKTPKRRAKQKRKPSTISAMKEQIPVTMNKEQERDKSYACFNVGKEFFAIDLDEVGEILHTSEIVSVPHLPESFSGVIKLRGESIPVLDLQKLLDEDIIDIEDRPCLIVNINDRKMGFLVDSDVDIIALSHARLYPMPDCYTSEETEFMEGIFWYKNKFIGILRPKELIRTLANWREEDEKI